MSRFSRAAASTGRQNRCTGAGVCATTRLWGAASFYRDPANAEVVRAIQRDDPESVAREAFHPRIAHHLHKKSVEFLRKKLRETFDGPTVVVTHMAPHYDSLTRSGLDAPIPGAGAVGRAGPLCPAASSGGVSVGPFWLAAVECPAY